MSGNSKRMVAFPYFGSKISALNWLYPLIHPHTHWVDLFGGSFAVTLNKPVSPIETVNDLNSDIINFFECLRDRPDQLIRKLVLTPYSREEYELTWHIHKSDSKVERARKFYVRTCQSFGSMGAQQKNKGWKMAVRTSRCHVSESVNRWLKKTDKLHSLVDRLKILQIENRDYRDVLERCNSDNCFIYADPPYDRGIRNWKNEYVHDFTDEDHIELSKHLHAHPGKVGVAGYESELMQQLYSDWTISRDVPKQNTLRNKTRQECMWTNYDPRELKSMVLF